MEKASIRAKAREKRGIESKPEVMLASDIKEGTRYESDYLITEPGVDAVKLLGRIPTKSVRSVWAQFLVDNLGAWKNVRLFLQVKRVLRDNGRLVVKCYNVNASKITKSLRTLGFEVREKKTDYSEANLKRLREHGDLTPAEKRYASREERIKQAEQIPAGKRRKALAQGIPLEDMRMPVILIAAKKGKSKSKKH